MNNWINANKIKLYSCSEAFARECNLQLVEAIPVSALEELFSNEGEELAREMYPWNDIPEMDEKNPEWWKEHGKQLEVFQNNIINKIQSKAFLEAYNIQDVKMQALKKEVEEITATCKKWYDAAMYFQDMGKIGINMEDPNMRKIPDAGEFDPNRPGVY
jgi:hypothetical protein